MPSFSHLNGFIVRRWLILLAFFDHVFFHGSPVNRGPLTILRPWCSNNTVWWQSTAPWALIGILAQHFLHGEPATTGFIVRVHGMKRCTQYYCHASPREYHADDEALNSVTATCFVTLRQPDYAQDANGSWNADESALDSHHDMNLNDTFSVALILGLRAQAAAHQDKWEEEDCTTCRRIRIRFKTFSC